MPTIATIFSGGEGVGIGAQSAGFTHLWGIELVDEIAQVARNNGFNTMTGDVFDVEPSTLEKPDVLHASPECQRASVANNKRGEIELDIVLGKRIEHYIETLRPKIFTLENVRPYKHFQAFKNIVSKLFDLGYMVDFQNLCAADFGVPQTRRRLILRASRIGLLPILPQKEKWTGWYQAIEDLIPDLPESKFAEWQIERFEKMDAQSFILAQGCYGNTLVKRNVNEAIFSITANSNQGGLRAFIVDDQQGANLPDGTRGLTIRQEREPTFTVSATQTKHPTRAWLSQGKVVAMTPRALARFQTFPDWYILSGKKVLDCKIVGNAVPPLLYEKLVRQFLDCI